MAIIPSDPITDDFNYDKLFQSMNLVTLQRILDAVRIGDSVALAAIIAELEELNGKVATETTLALIQAITSQMNFTGGALDVNATISTAGLATEPKQDTQIVNQGTDGATPPTIVGTGIRGWLRGIYEKVTALNLSAGLNKFLKDAVDTSVSIDTVTPANNEALPVELYNNLGIIGTKTNPLGTSLFDTATGSRQIVDLNGAAKTGEAFILIGSAFYGQPLNSLQWDTAFVGSGSETPLPGTHRLQTGTTANSTACLQTVRKARFMIAQFNIAHFGIQLNTANLLDVNCIRRFGVFDPISVTENGLFFELTSLDGIVPQWYLVAIKDGVETQRTAQADFNGAQADLFNPTAPVSAYEIQYNAGTAFFFQGTNFIHQVKGVPVYSGTYNFKVGFDIENTNGNTADNILDFRAGGVYRLGEPKGDPVSRAFIVDTVVVNGTGSISSASLSRTGNSGGNGTMKLYDGIDNTGFYMARIDIGGDDVRSIAINSTFTDGLFVEITGTGTNTAVLSFE